jgi:hypothetical protein
VAPLMTEGEVPVAEIESQCPPEISDILLEILTRGILSIRAAAWSGNHECCAVEADHLHKLPDLIHHYDPKKLDYYLRVERPSYLHELQQIPEKPGSNYEPLWNRLEQPSTHPET